MNIQDLPPAILVEIFHYLPFKERIRNARVSRLFQEISELSISEMKELIVNEDLAMYALKRGLEPLLAECSPKLRRIIVKDHSSKLSKFIINSLLDFMLPRVIDIHFHQDTPWSRFVVLKKRCPNLKYFTYHCGDRLICPAELDDVKNLKKVVIETDHFGLLADIDFKSGRLIINYGDGHFLSSIFKVVSNLKEISIKNMVGKMEILDELFERSPKLEFVDIRHGIDLGSLSYFWRLTALKHLIVRSVSIKDALFLKIAYHFPELETLHLLGLTKQITGEAITALSTLTKLTSFELEYCGYKVFFGDGFEQFSACENLKELILTEYSLTPECFVKIVRSCKNLATLKIHSIKGVRSPKKAVEILKSFSDLLGDPLVIEINRLHDYTNPSLDSILQYGFERMRLRRVWEKDEVKKVLKEMKKPIEVRVGWD